jgi:RNA polymerase sigma factor (sigma-70 family)
VKTAKARIIFDCLRKAVQPKGSDLTDGQLMRHYVSSGDNAAFGILVGRHGPMVLAVCRRILRHAEDAEDAFQAAFLVLARKGNRVAGRQTIGGWLHGVAYHVALDVRRRGARRKAKEQQVEDMPHPLVTPEEDQHELLAVLDRELNRLPEKYRLPVVLCELEGRSRKEAARQLDLPEGTLSSRLGRARKMLARRMAAHGPAVTGASLTALFASEAGAACVTGPLVASTIRAAGGVVSAGVVALAEGVLKAMLLTKIKAAALVLLLAASVGVGSVTLTYRAMAAETQTKADATRTLARAANPDKDDLEALRLEVEALRVSLQATREHVKGLEAEVLALQKPAASAVPGSAPADVIDGRVKRLWKKEPGSKAADPNPKPIPEFQAEDLHTTHTAAEAIISVFRDPLLAPPSAPLPVTPEREPDAAPATAPPSTVTVPVVPPSATKPPAATDVGFPVVEISPVGGKADNAVEARVSNEVKAKIRNAAASLMSDPTNKQAQDALKRALEELNGDDLPKATGR